MSIVSQNWKKKMWIKVILKCFLKVKKNLVSVNIFFVLATSVWELASLCFLLFSFISSISESPCSFCEAPFRTCGFLRSVLPQKPLAVRLWRLLGSVRLGRAARHSPGATLGHKMRRNCTDPEEQGRPSSPVWCEWVGEPAWSSLWDQDKVSLWVQPDCEPHRGGAYSRWAVQPLPCRCMLAAFLCTPRPPVMYRVTKPGPILTLKNCRPQLPCAFWTSATG